MDKLFKAIFTHELHLSRWTINSFLSGGDGVNRGHQSLNDFEIIMDNLGKRG